MTRLIAIFSISVCLDAHSVPHWGVPPGIEACLSRECLKASGRVKGLKIFPPVPFAPWSWGRWTRYPGLL